jgi:hypothetical protein
MVDPTLLTVLDITLSAVDPDNVGANLIAGMTAVTATYGDMFVTTGHEIVILQHADTGELVATAASAPCNQGFSTAHDVIKHIQAGNATTQIGVIGPFPLAHFGVTYGATANAVRVICTGTLAATKIVVVRFHDVGV